MKRYAQLNREQINSIQEAREPTDINEVEIEGAGRSGGVSVMGKHPIVMSDAVKRISGFNRKYLL